MRKFKPLWLSIAAVLASGIALAQTAPPAASASASGTMTEARVRALLAEKGFTRIDDIDFEDGAFETDATSADGKRVDVRVDPATGRLHTDAQASTLTEDDIKARLTAAGYSKIHDVDFDDGLWKAEADNALGNDVEVHLDSQDGRLLHVENDCRCRDFKLRERPPRRPFSFPAQARSSACQDFDRPLQRRFAACTNGGGLSAMQADPRGGSGRANALRAVCSAGASTRASRNASGRAASALAH